MSNLGFIFYLYKMKGEPRVYPYYLTVDGK